MSDFDDLTAGMQGEWDKAHANPDINALFQDPRLGEYKAKAGKYDALIEAVSPLFQDPDVAARRAENETKADKYDQLVKTMHAYGVETLAELPQTKRVRESLAEWWQDAMNSGLRDRGRFKTLKDCSVDDLLFAVCEMQFAGKQDRANAYGRLTDALKAVQDEIRDAEPGDGT